MFTHRVTQNVRTQFKKQFISLSVAKQQSNAASVNYKQVQIDYKPIRKVLVANRGK
jgi:hypothetical protein